MIIELALIFKKYNINNATEITENTLFKRDVNDGYSLRYWTD